MYCKKCSTENPKTAQFCKACGNSFSNLSDAEVIKFSKSFIRVNKVRVRIIIGLIVYSIISNIVLITLIEKVDPVSVFLATPTFLTLLIISIKQNNKRRIFIIRSPFEEVAKAIKQSVFQKKDRQLTVKELKNGTLMIQFARDKFIVEKDEQSNTNIIGDKLLTQDLIRDALDKNINFLEFQ